MTKRIDKGSALFPVLLTSTPAGSPPTGWALFADDPNKETVEVHRRRQGTSGAGGAQNRPRAEAPQRRDQPSGGGGGFGGGGGGGGGGFTGGSGGGVPGLGGCLGRLPWWAVLLIIAAFIIYSLMSSGGEQPQDTTGGTVQQQDPFQQETLPAAVDNQPQEAEPTIAVLPTRTPAPRKTSAPAAAGASGKPAWTVMLYEDADDQILEEDMYMDLNEVEKVGSTDQVNVVAQFDRYKGAYSGDGNWTSTRRYFIQKDSDLKRVKSEMVDDLGEVNMSDGETLSDFITWAMQNYPAEKYALILSDHGMGWPGGWSDPDPGGRDPSRAPIVTALDDNLYLMELDNALNTSLKAAGVDKLELIGMDACLMGHLEVFSALQPHARYAVASQETEPALGWAYTSFLTALTADPGMDGAQLGTEIVQSYIQGDQRIVDAQARQDFLRQGSPFGSMSSVSQADLTRQMQQDITLTVVDLSAIPALNQSVNNLVLALQDADQSAVASARNYAQSFTNIFGKQKPAPYIDLGSFVQMIKRESGDAQVGQAIDKVLAAEKQAVVAEKHGPSKRGATGVSIYFPNSTLYRSPVAGPQSYTMVSQRFAQESLWDDFLAFHYNDVAIKPNSRAAVVPELNAPSRSPGTGTISVSPITASSRSAAPGSPVRLTSDIKGSNIGYIYLFVGYVDKASNSIFMADTDYLESADTREVNGVYYPKWKENQAFTMALTWEPTVFAISDGKKSAVVALNPQTYGLSARDAEYTIDGTFTYAKDGVSRHARLVFRDGQLRRVFGFTEEQTGAPREIIPQAGDTFTIQETWMDLDASGRVTQTAAQDGETLTFGSKMFTWQEVNAAAGDYVVGFIVEDLDGNRQEVYTTITVR